MQEHRNPYSVPQTELGCADELGRSLSPNQRTWLGYVRFGTMLHVPFALAGILGAYALLTGDTAHTETVEAIVLPIYAWLMSIPISASSLMFYRKCRHSIPLMGQVWFIGWTATPTVALAIAGVAAMRY